MPSSIISTTESSWTSTVLTLRFLLFKRLGPNFCRRQSLAGTRIISKRKRNLHTSFWDPKLELTLWLCGRRAQSTTHEHWDTLEDIEVIDYVTKKEAAYLPRKLRGTVLFHATSSQMKVMLLSSNQWSIFCTSHRAVKSRHCEVVNHSPARSFFLLTFA